MSHASILAAETLQHLDAAVQDPREIDRRAEAGAMDASSLTMTRVRVGRQNVITPFYPGIVFGTMSMYERLQKAQLYSRPLVEAVVRYKRSKQLVTVTLRACMQPKATIPLFDESAWQYDLPLGETSTSVERIVDLVARHADRGAALPRRSGIVALTEERRNAQLWGISIQNDPNVLAERLHGIVTQGVEFANFA